VYDAPLLDGGKAPAFSLAAAFSFPGTKLEGLDIVGGCGGGRENDATLNGLGLCWLVFGLVSRLKGMGEEGLFGAPVACSDASSCIRGEISSDELGDSDDLLRAITIPSNRPELRALGGRRLEVPLGLPGSDDGLGSSVAVRFSSGEEAITRERQSMRLFGDNEPTTT
jgi:hypothetical protein